MTETKVSAFRDGYVIETQENFVIGNTYTINMTDDTGGNYNKQYTSSSSGNVIILPWEYIPPDNSNVCFTITLKCQAILCSLSIL